MALDRKRRGEQAWKEREGEAEMLANTIDTRCYGEDEFRRHGKVTGGEQMGEKEERRRRVRLYIAEKGASSVASSRTRSPQRRQRVTVRGSGEDDRRQAAQWRAGGGARLHLIFLKYL